MRFKNGWEAFILTLITVIAVTTAGAAHAGIGDILSGGASVVAGAAGGGLLGLLGAGLGAGFKWLAARQELEKTKLEYEQELKLQEMQIKARAAETEQEIQIARAEGSWRGLEASYRSEIAGTGWVANIKALFRPLLTLLLVALAGAIIWMLQSGKLTGHIDPEVTAALIVYSVQSIIFSASTAVAWWFGDRSFAPSRRY